MDISFLLPTNREPKYAKHVINHINSIQTDYKYEIIVCSQIDPSLFSGDNVVNLVEQEQQGPIAAFNFMADEVAKGEYTVCLVDDHIPWDNDFFSFMEFLNSDFFDHGRSKVTSFNTRHIPQRCPIIGEDWCGGLTEKFNRRHHTTVRFPIVHQDVRRKLLNGFIFNPGFRYHASDIWMGFWFGEEEGPVYEAPNASYKQYAPLRNYAFEKQDCLFYHKLKREYLKGYRGYV